MIDPKLAIQDISVAAIKAVANATHAVGRPIVRADSADFHFPDDTVLIALSFEGLAAKSVRVVRSSAEEDEVLSVSAGSMVYVTSGLRLSDIARIYLTGDDEQVVSGSVTLDMSYLSRRFTSPPMLVQWPGGKGERQILELQSDRQDRRKELVAHLNANRIYYSNAIHQALDSGTIVAMLAEYSWNGRPLIDQVEPQPLTMAGNYLVFRAPLEPVDPSGVSEGGKQKNWGELLHDRAIVVGAQSADDRLIPLPTAGVFAEAVLGRSNSAEKLDITRFWNWQDSPIPLTPPDIAPVGTESRAMAEDLKPGQLGQPVLNILNPQTLPNPAGLGAVLGTLASPNMFRDMSGLAGTQNLVQSGMQETMQGATDAGQITSANLRTEAQKAVAMGQIAADIVKSVMGGGGGGGSSAGQTMSGSGATINHGKKMDAAAAKNAGGPAAGGGGPVVARDAATSNAGGSTQARGGSRLVDEYSSTSSAPGYESKAFQRTLYGDVGESAVDAMGSAMTMASTMADAAPEIAIGAEMGVEVAAGVSKRATFDILADENYIDNFSDANYDELSGLIYLEYEKKGRYLTLPVHVVSDSTTDADVEEDAIQSYYDDLPPNSAPDKVVLVPRIFNPHTTPRLASYAKKVNAWQKEVDNAFELALFSLQMAIIVGSMAPGEGFGAAPSTQVLRLPIRRFAARTAMRLASEAQMVGRVSYGATDLSRLAQAARVSKGADKGKNFAAIEFKNAAGQLEKRGASSQGTKHAEEVLKEGLAKDRVPPDNVTRLYSEYQPCTQRVGGTPCAEMVSKAFPKAKVTYSFPYSDAAARELGRGLLKDAIEQLKRFFAAGGVP